MRRDYVIAQDVNLAGLLVPELIELTDEQASLFVSLFIQIKASFRGKVSTKKPLFRVFGLSKPRL
jgi:hypothetical protein